MQAAATAPAHTPDTGHPTGLYVLFTTEMWERFAYYGMRALLALYMGNALLMNKETSSLIYGNYTSLVYLTPLLGGYMADRYWGNRHSIRVGGLLMAAGQFALFGSASMYVAGQAGPSTAQMGLFLLGLTLMIFGNGFFKPNISSMVGSLYPKGDTRIDAAYTIFYMGINLGAFFSPLVCGTLGEVYDANKNIMPGEFKWGFLAAGIGMLIGSITFELLKNKYIINPDGSPLGARPERTSAASPVVPVGTDAPVRAETIAPPAARGLGLGMGAIAALAIAIYAAIAFYTGYDASKDFVLQEVLKKADWIGALVFSAMIIMPLVVLSDKSLTSREKEKIYVILILSFFVIFFWGAFEQAGISLTYFAAEQTKLQLTDTYTMPASYFQSANALFIIAFAPVFAVLWTWMGKRGFEPSSPLKMSIGLMLLAVSYLVIAFGVKGVDASTKVSMFWLITMYLLQTFGELCLSPIGLALVNKLAPARLASLLMAVWFLATAAGNKLAGVLSALYPPGPGEFKKAAAAGLDLPAILNSVGAVPAEVLKQLEKLEIPAKWPTFLGFQINDLYSFFMIFVVLSAASSLTLFLIYRRLTRMMDEPVAGAAA